MEDGRERTVLFGLAAVSFHSRKEPIARGQAIGIQLFAWVCCRAARLAIVLLEYPSTGKRALSPLLCCIFSLFSICLTFHKQHIPCNAFSTLPLSFSSKTSTMASPSQRSFKAVFFDIGGVVVGSPFQGIADYEQENNLPVNYINVAM